MYSLILWGLLPGVSLYTCTYLFSEVFYRGCHCIHVLTRSQRPFASGVTVYVYSFILCGLLPGCHCMHVLTHSLLSFTKGATVYMYSLILWGLLPGVSLYTCTHSFSEVFYQGCHCIHVLTRSPRSFAKGVTVYMYSLIHCGLLPGVSLYTCTHSFSETFVQLNRALAHWAGFSNDLSCLRCTT